MSIQKTTQSSDPVYVEELSLTQITADQSANTCGPYWYLVQSRLTPHTAFIRREALLNWLDERGLSLTKPLVDEGVHSHQKIIGKYGTISHMSPESFYGLGGVLWETRVLSNSYYTLGRITETPDGLRVVHYLNPNVSSRVVFDYKESKAIFG